MSELRERLEEIKASSYPDPHLHHYTEAITLATEAVEENERLRATIAEMRFRGLAPQVDAIASKALEGGQT
jgi:hypothetical protein